MADTGFKTFTTVVSLGTWNASFTAANLNTSNDVRASSSAGVTSTAEVDTFTFGVPSGKVIDGIEIVGEFRSNTAGDTATLTFSLSWDNGGTYTSTKSDTITGTTDVTRTYGGATDTWGRSWTDTEFANGTFQVKIQGSNSNAIRVCQLDYMAVKVYYSDPSTSRAGRLSLLGVG